MSELEELNRIIQRFPASLNRVDSAYEGFLTTKSVVLEKRGSITLHKVTTKSPLGVDYVWDYISKNV